MEEYNQNKKLIKDVLDKKVEVEKSIEQIISDFISEERQVFTFNAQPTPRSIYENLD